MMVIDPDRLAVLEEERTFLLRSLRDLDAEHAAGDVDEHDYVALRDGYTKRAADVTRELDHGRAGLPRARRVGWRRRALVAAAVAALAAGAGWLVARSSGDRLTGEEITGGAPRDDVAAMLAEARSLGVTDPVAALERYGEVLELRPDHAEALAYSGFLVYRVGTLSSDEALADEAVGQARGRIGRAIEADPRYADPHCFLAIIAAEQDGDMATARTEGETCLELGPPAELRAAIEPAFDDAGGDDG